MLYNLSTQSDLRDVCRGRLFNSIDEMSLFRLSHLRDTSNASKIFTFTCVLAARIIHLYMYADHV